MGKGMSIKTTLQAIRAARMTAAYNHSTREFRVNYRGGKEETAYYTHSADDAVITARKMRDAHSEPPADNTTGGRFANDATPTGGV